MGKPMEKQKFSMGIDIGGTNVKIGGRVGDLLLEGDVRRIVAPETNDLLANIESAVTKFMIENDIFQANVKAVGICCPGPLNPNSGVVINPPNLPLRNFPLKKYFSEKFPNSRVEVLNDANAAAVGEYSVLKKEMLGSPIRNMVFLTLGTGVGGGLILDGKFYRGLGQGGELGHATIKFNGAKCKCGRRGCLEAYVSESAIMKFFENAVDFVLTVPRMKLERFGSVPNFVAPQIIKGVLTDEPKNRIEDNLQMMFQKTMKTVAGYLAAGLGNFVNIFHPDAIVLGGGITDALGVYILQEVQVAIKNEAFASLLKEVSILPASLGNSAGWQGAMIYADEKKGGAE